jgi:hydroxymethylbilane synthase
MSVGSSAKLRLGTRASPLARWQAEWVAARLGERGVEVELVPITTQGDVKSGPLGQIGGQGLFTKELQRALLEGKIDLAVHSCKDLPTAPVEGLVIAAVPPRESTADVLVSHQATRIEALPPRARVGTGSLRRKAQLLHLRPDLLVEDIRGNVETRLRKLDEGQYDAIVLAEAGLKRLGLADRIVHVIPRRDMLPAVGQGALAIETRTDDQKTQSLLAPLDHRQSHWAVVAERALLSALRAGCLAPVGALAVAKSVRMRMEAVVLSPDGRQRLTARGEIHDDVGEVLGELIAKDLLEQGAEDLIEGAKAAGDASAP